MTDEMQEANPEFSLEECRRWVNDLAVKHRAKQSVQRLMAVGDPAIPALREGLSHPDPAVRVGCCQVLDHHMDDTVLPDLIENLRHDDERVRSWALHALACERCKEGVCRPGEDQVIPLAIEMLIGDKSRRVRETAAGMLGPSVHRSPEVLRALEYARDHDAHPVVRNIARWYTPGGPRYERLMPKPPKKKAAKMIAE